MKIMFLIIFLFMGVACSDADGAGEDGTDGTDDTAFEQDVIAEDATGEATECDRDGDGHRSIACGGADCDDSNETVFPGAAERCDGIDNDCDDDVDEGLDRIFYADNDEDGFGVSEDFVVACSVPPGYADSGGDCDDDDPAVNPGAEEICDEIDNDCDNETDEDVQGEFYFDEDEDGYGGSVSVVACSPPEGYIVESGDCNDSNQDIHPGTEEVCDNVDNDCDSSVDEGVRPTLYHDTDHDGHGNPADTTTNYCAPYLWWVLSNDDCDDSEDTIYTGAPELCDGIDNNCDDVIDDGLTLSTFYVDADGDGYGVPTGMIEACAAPPSYADNADDCYDLNAEAYPGQTDYPDQSGVCSTGWIISCSADDRGDGSYDYDCNGIEELHTTLVLPTGNCGTACENEGWIASTPPGCGETADYKDCNMGTYGCGYMSGNDLCQCCH